jgi:hypothetical protein
MSETQQAGHGAVAGPVEPTVRPTAWMWQHCETGRTGFVEDHELDGEWKKDNPRLRIVGPLYAEPPMPQEPVAWMEPSWLNPAQRNWPGDQFTAHACEGMIPVYAAPVTGRPAAWGWQLPDGRITMLFSEPRHHPDCTTVALYAVPWPNVGIEGRR